MSDLPESYLRERFHFHHNCPATLSKLVASARPFPIVIVITIGAYSGPHPIYSTERRIIIGVEATDMPMLAPRVCRWFPSPAAVASNLDYRSQQLRVGSIK